jgi:uncharacterized membrane protein (UPF0136 family)
MVTKIYSALLVALAIYGFIKTGSKISLIAGSFFGLSLLGLQFWKKSFSEKLQLLISTLVNLQFGIRYILTHKQLLGVLFFISLVANLYYLKKIFKKQTDEK